MRDLAERVVFVTGGGRGLGEAVCRVLSAAGATVVAADVREDLAKAIVADLAKMDCAGSALKLDVTDRHQVDEAVRSVCAEFGRIDALVNNAGVDVTVPFEDLAVDDWDRIVNTNLRGAFLTSKAVWPVMKEQGAGHIVNVASTASKRAWPNAIAYHSSKWGLLGFSHALHVEGRAVNIKVTAVVAGGMRTPFLFERFPDLDPGVLQDPANVAEAIRFVLTQPHETVVPEMMVIPMRETSWP